MQIRRRLVSVALFAALLALAGLDIALDLREGALPAHAWIEGAMMVVCLAGGALELRRRSRAIAATRRDADAWRREAEALSAGVSAAIDRQFDRWALTAAERETAYLLLKGLSHRELAAVRDTTEAASRQMARSIYAKAGVGGRSELAAFFLEDLLAPRRSAAAPAAKMTSDIPSPSIAG